MNDKWQQVSWVKLFRVLTDPIALKLSILQSAISNKKNMKKENKQTKRKAKSRQGEWIKADAHFMMKNQTAVSSVYN